MSLNKGEPGDEWLWDTYNYELEVGEANYGYNIVNKQTYVTEMVVDTEPQAVMAMMWLQHQYEEVMADPEREFKVRKAAQQSGRQPARPGTGSLLQ